jgi:hypothetical protein
LRRIRDYVTALRSGEYDQTQNRLARNVNGRRSYCCEGVAFERYGPDLGFTLEWDDGTCESGGASLMIASDPEHPQRATGNTSTAPTRFWTVMGLSVPEDDEFVFVLPEGLFTIGDEDDFIAYATLNDDGFTFSQIADMLTWQFLCPSAD